MCFMTEPMPPCRIKKPRPDKWCPTARKNILNTQVFCQSERLVEGVAGFYSTVGTCPIIFFNRPGNLHPVYSETDKWYKNGGR